jgi:hypothetical protein
LAQVVTGSIGGTVRDESGALLPGVTVTITSPELPGGPATFVTNAQGQYRLTGLRPGAYRLEASLTGFSQYVETDLVVIVGGNTERNISLKVATLQESVTVTGQSPIIDVTRVAVTTNMPKEVIENIPSMRYGFHEYVKWAPGVAAADIQGSTGNASVLGSTSSENTYLYDGVNSNDPRNGGLWLGGAVNAVQEVQIVTMGASAEYQTAQGAVFNTVLRSGTNTFHGRYEQFWFHNDLISEPIKLNCNCPEGTTGYNQLYRQDLLADVAGPIVKDKLWFFGAYIYNNRKETNPGVDPNIPFKYYQRAWITKVNWRAGDSTNIDGMYNPKWRNTPPLPTPTRPIETVTASDGRSRTFNMALNRTFGNRTLLTVRAGGYLDPEAYSGPFDENGESMSPEEAGQNSFHTDTVTGIACCGVPNISLTTFYRWGESAKLTHFFEGDKLSHDVGFGAQFEQTQEDQSNAVPGGVTYQDSNGQPSQATFRAPYVTGSGYRSMGFWVQDRLRFSKRLTIDVGVRWDRMRAYSPDEPAVNELLQPTGETVTGLGDLFTWNTVAPRVGANYALTDNGKSTLRASYGRAYRPVFLNDYSIIYPNISSTVVAGYNATTGRYTNIISTTNPIANIQLDPNLKVPYTDSFSVGFDRELITNMALNASFVHKEARNQIGWNDVGATYASTTVPLPTCPTSLSAQCGQFSGQPITVFDRVTPSSTSLFMRTNTPGFFNKYNGMVLAVEKRMSHSWQANFSYTLSKSEGCTTGSQDPNAARVNCAGLLGTDRTHVFSTLGMYQFEKINGALAVNFIAQIGNPFAPQAQVRLTQGNITVNVAPNDGTYKQDTQKILYLRYNWHVFQRGAKRIDLMAELANALQDMGNQSIVSNNIFATTFAQSNSWTLPRRLYFSTAFKF